MQDPLLDANTMIPEHERFDEAEICIRIQNTRRRVVEKRNHDQCQYDVQMPSFGEFKLPSTETQQQQIRTLQYILATS